MPTLTFSHRDIDSALRVNTGANNISWGYNMNTRVYPTYGGEVVQVLSAFTDDITVTGEVASHKKLEAIYEWFLEYFQKATQGRSANANAGTTAYNQAPVIMRYHDRNWEWQVKPKELPGFRYAVDAVALPWRMTAAVVGEPPGTKELNIKAAVKGIKQLHAGIGYDPDDPFSTPFKDNAAFDPKATRQFFDSSADYFNDLIKAYYKGDWDDLLGNIGAKPAFLNPEVEKQKQGEEDKKSGDR